MKKVRIIVMILIAVIVVSIADIAKAENRISTKFDNSIKASYGGLQTNHTISLFKKTYTNSVQSGKVFCTSFFKTQPSGTCSAKTWNGGVESTANKKIAVGIGAMINKARNLSSEKDGKGSLDWDTYFYTELAINKFLYNYNGKKANNNVSKLSNWSAVASNSKYEKIYSAGKTAYDNYGESYVKIVDAKIATNSYSNLTTLTMRAKVKCYDDKGKLTTCSFSSKSIKISKNGETAESVDNVTLTKGESNTYYLSASKSVTPPVEGTDTYKVTFYVKGKFSYAVAQEYDCGSSYQSLTPNSLKTLNVYSEDTEKITKKFGAEGVECSLKIVKHDASDSNKKLGGAKFELYNAGGTEKIASGTTDERTGIIEFNGLEEGTYTYREVKAPSGYLLDQTPHNVILSNSGGSCTETVNRGNNKQTGKLIIKKTDGLGNFVKGAKIKIYTTTATEIIDVGDINPEGEDGSFTAEDTRDYSFNYLKFDANGNLNPNGPNDYFVTDGNEKVIEGLTVGETYYVYEASTPENSDYAITTGADYYTFESPGEHVIELINKHSSFKISKQDITTKEELPGAKLQILDSRGIVIEEWTSTNEQKTINALADGDYTLVETTAPKGYAVSESIKFTIKDGKLADDADNTLVMYDKLTGVDVPDTLSARSLVLVLVGMVIIALGIGVFLYGVKKKDEV